MCNIFRHGDKLGPNVKYVISWELAVLSNIFSRIEAGTYPNFPVYSIILLILHPLKSPSHSNDFNVFLVPS